MYLNMTSDEINKLSDIIITTIPEELTKKGFKIVTADDPIGEYVRENKIAIDYNDLRNCFSRSDLKSIAKIAGSPYLAFITITSRYEGQDFWNGGTLLTYYAELRIVSVFEDDYIYKKYIVKEGRVNKKTFNTLATELISDFNFNNPKSLHSNAPSV